MTSAINVLRGSIIGRHYLDVHCCAQDHSSNAAQTLLKNQYDIDGCQITSLAEYGEFIKVSPGKCSIQILHTGLFLK